MAAWFATHIFARKAALRFCLRTTVAALLAFGLMQFWALPLRGLWAVLTAVVVMQMSVGGSLRATTEYVVGTFAGAIYGSVLGVLVPHTTVPAMIGVLALAVAPLAYLAALTSSFRVAPFTAILVLLLANQFGQGGPIASALTRLGEVVLGGIVAVFVSILVLPERAHGLGLDKAKRALEQVADALQFLLSGFTRQIADGDIQNAQDEVGRSVTAFQTVIEEARREQLIGLAARPDPGPLSRTLLRLRHDLVILGRAASVRAAVGRASFCDRNGGTRIASQLCRGADLTQTSAGQRKPRGRTRRICGGIRDAASRKPDTSPVGHRSGASLRPQLRAGRIAPEFPRSRALHRRLGPGLGEVTARSSLFARALTR